MEGHTELFAIADALDGLLQTFEQSTGAKKVKALEAAIDETAKSHSGSWFGYHARVYFDDFATPPPGEHFDPEYGLAVNPMMRRSRGSGLWMEFNSDEVLKHIYEMAEVDGIDQEIELAKYVREKASMAQSEASSILELSSSDEFLVRLKSEIVSVEFPTRLEVVNRSRPKRSIITHDTRAINEGTKLPPHMEAKADIWFVEVSYTQTKVIARKIRTAASHLERLKKASEHSRRIGTNVFIGHGRSKEWRILKDFISDRLHLPWDEFNRVPVAGTTNIARLSTMLDAAAIAFLVMTGEDETAEGELRARENVVHEAGLFQGRLGFERAIILLEEGCSEFSNIHGLGQLRFPRGNITACFEDIRLVLEREGIILPADDGK